MSLLIDMDNQKERILEMFHAIEKCFEVMGDLRRYNQTLVLSMIRCNLLYL